ncbi:LOW QUALITY PROTEIN: NACHT, LRR and PYD domains-containing protein 12-like [Colossoma macropomum]|uniref:LOW QUALITY PROTEIN: NACHT, LRR and PYD domains-containing protein 12-like n=1 Tax=Colossoma macropomum TaxID=42526 RepID=UPI001863B618|nr:LOW QUALITY PROTEIN: NACHT, LRR and PYD domains-containing protein 12-like [Colossoma macropomum]
MSSKMSLSEEQDTQEAERLDHGERPDSPVPSCVSMKSDHSMDELIELREDDSSTKPRLVQGKRSNSPEPSSVSKKSDHSMDEIVNLREDDCSTELRLAQSKRSNSPVPSCVTMKSDHSMDEIVNLREDSHSTQLRLVHGKRSNSPEPSCMSMKSDHSMDEIVNLREDDCSTELRLVQGKRSNSPEPSCVSMKSDHSMDEIVNLREDDCSTQLRAQNEMSETTRRNEELIIKELEHKVISLVKNQLKRFVKLLNLDYPACSEREVEDEENQSVREGALKITLHVLRTMNQTDLANTLQTKLAPSCHQKLKSILKEKCQEINEGISNPGTSTLLNEIYTELYVTEAGSGEVNNEHEVRQIETASRRPATQETPIKCNDIFKDKPIRTVLTKGVAGIGKTVSVQKFILDWAEEKANQDVLFIFPLPFRELNLMKKKLSLLDLLYRFFTDIKELKPRDIYDYKVMFIFDGLDECRLPLDFQSNESVFDVRQSASVDVLLTNLIKGNLLPSAHLWITTRPAAANQIPSDCINQITEVRGFSDPQKEEYFRKRISDQSLAERIIAHMKSSRSLYIMCHIPVFCWIAATVLERMLGEAESGEIPKTLTQMFTHFLIFQIKHSSQKYQRKSDIDHKQTRKIILALGKLAFQQLEKGNLIFYEVDLTECGIDVREVSVYSGVCTQIFREEFGLNLGKVFSFVHLSVQEFLAALYAFLSFISNNTNVLLQQTTGYTGFEEKTTMSDFLKTAVDKALQSENGHLDLFLRFLLGLSLESNQTLLRGLMTQTGYSSQSRREIVEYIKEKIRENPSPEKTISLFHCLNELNDHSLVQEVQRYLKRGGSSGLSGAKLSPAQWSAVAFVMLNSEEELDEFDLNKFDRSEECLLRLLPVAKASRKVVLHNYSITEEGCAALVSALKSNPSQLRELNLSYNKAGLKLLSDLLEDPHCKLERLQLSNCSITEEGCAALVSALKSNPSHLRELDLSLNKPGESEMKLLSDLLKDPHFKLEKLLLFNCSVTEEGCAALVSALNSNPSHLKELNLNLNKPGQSGVKLLSDLLQDPQCKLETLQLEQCSITEEGCAALASALKSNPSHLRELNLNYNKPGESGVKLLSDLLKDPHCKLENLQLSNCSITGEGCAALVSALKSNPSHLRELNLNYNEPGESGVNLLSDLLKDPYCKLEKLHLSSCSITEEGCAALVSALKSNPSHLRELDLNSNNPGESGVNLLSDLLKDPHCKLENLHLSNCSITKEGCAALVSALKSNPSHLRELNLNFSNPGESGVKLLSDLLKDPHCKLEILQVSSCGIIEEVCDELVLALKLNPSHLRELNLNISKPGESGVKLLSELLEDPQSKLEKLQLRYCDLTEKSCAVLSSALSSNSSSLRELNLGNNQLQDSGVKLLSAGLRNPQCKLEKLDLSDCSITEEGCAALVSALKLNPSHLRELNLSYNKPGESGVKLLSDLLEDPYCKLDI